MRRTKLFMDTVVDIQVTHQKTIPNEAVEAKIDRAFELFRNVEQSCSRFSSDSELIQACKVIGKPVPISPFLYEPLKFALEVAKLTDGKFDPAIGKVMEEQGYNRHYLTGEFIESPSADSVNYQDIVLDKQAHTLFLKKPLVIDLGAVAKGFAIDLAANELKKDCTGFLINAGGDIYAGGVDKNGCPWKIGIQHPELKDQSILAIELSNEAICTSGSYERKSASRPGLHHIIDPKTRHSPNDMVSCSVVAPYAMMADAFATAAFLFGREKGEKLLKNVNLKGIFISPDLQIDKIGGRLNDI